MNLDTVLRITARVTGVREFTKLDRAIKKSEKVAREAEKGFKKMLDSRLFRTAAVAAAGLTAAIALSTKAAIDFESSMAGVRKVVDGLDSPKALAEIKQELLEISNNSPLTAKGFADIYAAAGQAGIARENLKEFALLTEQVAVAFDMTAEEAGTAMAKLQTSLGLTLPEVDSLTDAMNHLSNNSASTAAELVDFTLRAGQAGQSAGLTAEQTAAFGSAMIASGAEANVAATSFRNMVKALSRGPSMTDRQIGALDRLGFAQSDAVTNEAIYTDQVRTQSESRISIARHETDQLAKELNRRFRDQMTIIRDGLDDETEEFTERLQDQADARITALQRQQREEIEAARKRVEINGTSAQKEIHAIQDAFDQRIDAVRDKLGDELKERRRADRDRLTAIQDDMNDRKEAELAGLESNFNELKNKEQALMKERIAEIEAAAKEGATMAAEALAKGLQEDAIGTITDVFNRIRELPKEAQLSVVSDLFGDEARAILPLINNTQLLEDAMRLVGEKTAFAGSRLDEYLVQSATTANEIKEAQGQVENLAIVFGQTFAPALAGLLEAFAPVIQAFTWLIQNVPGLGPVLGILSVAFIGLIAILPAIGGLVTLMAAIGSKAALFAGLATAIGLIKGAFLAVAAVLTGPLGLAALLVIAIGSVYAFRDEIGQIFANIAEGISITLQTLGETFTIGFQAIYDFVSGIFQQIFDFYNNTFIQPVVTTAQQLHETFIGIFHAIGEAIRSPFVAAFASVKAVMNSIVQRIASGVNAAIQIINRVIAGANRLPAVNIPFVPFVQVPAFAEGGMVTGPTLGLVGEAGPEYIIPAGKAQAFAENILAGVRGPAAIPRFAEGGFVAPSTANVNIQTGAVTRMGGQDFVTKSDMSRAVQSGVKQTLDLLRRDGTLRSRLAL
jgi:hypothetical protein